MAKQPAVVLIARHGPRLDISDQSWHLSTPTPYDPPITYGGWNQSRSLGVRIASLLYAREQSYSNAGDSDGEKHVGRDGDERPRKRRRLKHRVVIHTSPFLRCLQTSIAIAAGMAQYNPGIETENKKRPVSVSPRVRASDGPGTAKGLSSIAEPTHDFAHTMARKALHEHKRHPKSKLRVDAFLGEWLNPQYFEGITAPPPSAMMVATAKAELMESETVEIFQPTTATRFATTSLWGGANGTTNPTAEDTLDDWKTVEEALPGSPTRSRASTATDTVQPLTSTLPKQETTIYRPPTPQYAVSPAQQIPRGYVTHARNACTDVDYQWDSSRQPDSWGDGGEYGEEWSSMHKRFRRGLNRLVQWYTHDDAEQGEENAIGVEQVGDDGDEEVKEDLVVVLVTHGAGCNALIGALTGQPVLLDVGMASLTMAVRKDDAPPLNNFGSPRDKYGRRASSDGGLSSVYEMKFVSSSEHLRPGVDPRRAASQASRANTFSDRDTLSRFQERVDIPRSNTNSSLGSIRRPSAAAAALATSDNTARSSSLPRDGMQTTSPVVSAGLWTPPASRTPVSPVQVGFLPLTENGQGRAITSGNITSPTDNPGTKDISKSSPLAIESTAGPTDNGVNDQSANSDSDTAAEFPKPGDSVPPYLSRRLSQERLWGSRPSGAQVERKTKEPKRRWTVEQD